jgi:hypothetical protein
MASSRFILKFKTCKSKIFSKFFIKLNKIIIKNIKLNKIEWKDILFYDK